MEQKTKAQLVKETTLHKRSKGRGTKSFWLVYREKDVGSIDYVGPGNGYTVTIDSDGRTESASDWIDAMRNARSRVIRKRTKHMDHRYKYEG